MCIRDSADIERLLEEAVDYDSLESRDGLQYRGNKPFSGWVKRMYDSGRVRTLLPLKRDGNPDGPQTMWHENGQKMSEGTYKDGKMHGIFRSLYEDGQKRTERTWKDGKRYGPMTVWHENGQKRAELIWKNDEPIFARFWNRAGEEVRTSEDALK